MPPRSLILTLVLILLVALAVIGRFRRHLPARTSHHRTSLLIQRIERTTRAFDQLAERELRLSLPSAPGQPAPQGGTPRPG
jgi:hypothetical protein